MLLGNYLSTVSLWQDRSIPRVRFQRSNQLLAAGQQAVRGNVLQATDIFLSHPTILGKQATWEFDLAICQLEAGLPDVAATHFTKALTLDPDLTVRPIAAYYLQKMGKPVPPKREAPGAKKPTAPSPSGAPVTPQPLPASPSGASVPVSPSQAPTEPAKASTSEKEKAIPKEAAP